MRQVNYSFTYIMQFINFLFNCLESCKMVFLIFSIDTLIKKYISLTLYQHLPYELVAIFIFFAH